jgi:LacI family transcriptional regulator
MITIKDIAKEAQVSEGTVDRVIHNRGNVSKKTETKIKKILDYHNFSVNPVASALAMKNKHSIAVLIPSCNESDLFWKSPYLGTQKAAEEVKSFGVEINYFSYNQYDSFSYFLAFKALIETKPTSVIIVPNFREETEQIISQLENSNIPYLFLNIDFNNFDSLTYVGEDSYTAGLIAGKLMYFQSSKSPEFLIIQSRYELTQNNAVSNRIEGFKDYFFKNNINTNTQILKIENLNNSKETKQKINSYLERHPEIKGVFVPSSRIHIVVDYMEEKYLKKLKLIGFDNTSQNNNCLLNNSVAFIISQKPFEQGYEAVRVLSDYLIHKKEPSKKIFLPIDILIKENVNYNNGNESIYENNKNA